MTITKKFLLASVVILLLAITFICLVFPEPLELIKRNAIITPVAFIAAAFANATAVGGGFLFIPLFIYAYGLAPIAALKLSLATQAFGMTSGAIGWSLSFIEKKALVIGAMASLVGMWLGVYVFQIDSQHIKLAFGWISILIFLIIMIEIKLGQSSHRNAIETLGFLPLVGYTITAVAGGLVTAWTAIGVGEFVALYLMFVYRIRIETAIGTGVAILAIDSIAGLIFHTSLGGIHWDLLVFTVPGVILGGFWGARTGRYIEQRIIQKKQLDESSHKEELAYQSPLKWTFAIIILVDGLSILTHSLLYTS